MASIVATRKRAGFSAAARQRRMGPAPFASFEQDLSDELDDSPEERRVQLPGIQEDASPAGTASSLGAPSSGLSTTVGGLQTPSTPRIDISRASSSSHHEEEGESGDSRGSTPERELFAGQGGLGFKEEGTAELRSSTEELDFHEDAQERERRRERLQRRKERGRGSMQPVFKYELEAQSEKERKDSACSLPVSGRTSRLSSVGSAASGASSAASALSVGSRALSAVSAVSAATSRSPSPHRMLLETSFCGSKPIPTQSIDLDSPCKHETESLEKVLLSRQTDPTKVVIAVECTPTSPVPPTSPSVKPASLNLAESGTKVVQSFPAVVHNIPSSELQRSPKPAVVHHKVAHEEIRRETRKDVEVVPISVPEPVLERTVVENEVAVVENEVAVVENEVAVVENVIENEVACAIETAASSVNPQVVNEAPVCASPKPSRHHAALRKAAEETRSEIGSRTPSPSTSRKSSFQNLFRKTDSPLSPDSPTSKRKNVFTTKLKEASDGLRERSRSRSKSNERNYSVIDGKTKKDSKNKSVFSSLFKKKTKKSGSSGSGEEGQSPQEHTMSPEEGAKASVLTDAIGNVEFTFSSEPLADRRSVIHERVVSEDREEKEIAEAATVEVPPKIPAKPSETSKFLETVKLAEKSSQREEHKQLEEIFVAAPTVQHLALERLDSSDSEMDRSRDESVGKVIDGQNEALVEMDHERKGLVMQDSFEDELPYVPTTLPQERSMVVPIVPVRQRLCPEVCATERPRSTTPINPANLEEFVLSGPLGNTPPPESERLRISLPREDSLNNSVKPLKSPRRVPLAKSWVEFAESGIRNESRRPSVPTPVSPPPLPPRASPPHPYSTTPPPLPPAKSWVNFEEIPERRKPPKKIQTIPSRGPVLEVEAAGGGVTYNYVKPEDCSCSESVDAFGLVSERGASAAVPHRCECHGGHGQHSSGGGAGGGHSSHAVPDRRDEMRREDVTVVPQTRLDVVDGPDRSSIMSDSSYDFSTNPYTQGATPGGLKPSMKPFGMDLDVHSNRSSIISQDEGGSPESPPPNGGL